MNRAMEAVNVPSNIHASPSKAAVFVDGRDGLPMQLGATKTTSNAQNRMTCLGENEMADRQQF